MRNGVDRERRNQGVQLRHTRAQSKQHVDKVESGARIGTKGGHQRPKDTKPRGGGKEEIALATETHTPLDPFLKTAVRRLDHAGKGGGAFRKSTKREIRGAFCAASIRSFQHETQSGQAEDGNRSSTLAPLQNNVIRHPSDSRHGPLTRLGGDGPEAHTPCQRPTAG